MLHNTAVKVHQLLQLQRMTWRRPRIDTLVTLSSFSSFASAMSTARHIVSSVVWPRICCVFDIDFVLILKIFCAALWWLPGSLMWHESCRKCCLHLWVLFCLLQNYHSFQMKTRYIFLILGRSEFSNKFKRCHIQKPCPFPSKLPSLLSHI